VKGIPLGIQLIADYLGEPKLLQALAALEQTTKLANLVATPS